MLRRLGLLGAALAVFTIAGGHWAALQAVAWTQMVRDYTRTSGSVLTAVAQTFDGEHPCGLCKVIATAKAGEHRSDQTLADNKTAKFGSKEKVPPPAHWQASPEHVATAAPAWPPGRAVFRVTRGERPPVPPPRAA